MWTQYLHHRAPSMLELCYSVQEGEKSQSPSNLQGCETSADNVVVCIYSFVEVLCACHSVSITHHVP